MDRQERLIPFALLRNFLYHGIPLLRKSRTLHSGEQYL